MSRNQRIFLASTPSSVAAADPIVVTTTVTPAQFKAMDTTTATSVTVVPAPGAGNLIELVSGSVNMQYGGVAYATGTGSLCYVMDFTGAANPFWINSGLLLITGSIKQTFSEYCNANPLMNGGAGNGLGVSILVNKALQLNIDAGVQYTAGNSPFVVVTRYRIVALL